MIKIHHINCLKIVTAVNDNVIGHCVLIESDHELFLIDTGVGLLDTRHPNERIGEQLIEMAGFRFNEDWTAVRQISALGLENKPVTHCIISHLDPDHIGGLADFPDATVHIGKEEYDNFNSGNPRYLTHMLDHHPVIQTYAETTDKWFGLEARKVNINPGIDIYLIPLFGHTLGHCGVAFRQDDKWFFYIGDAYYMKIELTDNRHPVNDLAKDRADNNEWRLNTLHKISEFINHHPDVEVFGYHDIEEFNPLLKEIK
ncbi:MBL fold metallo-hydrolase [Sphingobacterium spiritivorum]|uniref:MBL fold metallo-hydrolase n=1 Tax=Sphingobacterium spiritivorum TaxID=258 RepID=UPI003DA429C0